MRNRADNPYRDGGRRSSVDGDALLGRRPQLRIRLLFAALAIPVAVIAWRLWYLQDCLADRYLAELGRTVERFEAIPSRDGRIIAANGEVLAEDHEIFGVTVHYRWLEDPPDPLWIR